MVTLAGGRPTGRRGCGMTIKGRSERPEEAESQREKDDIYDNEVL